MYSLKKQRVTGFCGQWILQLVTLLEAYSGFLVHVPLSGMYVSAIRYLCTCSNYWRNALYPLINFYYRTHVKIRWPMLQAYIIGGLIIMELATLPSLLGVCKKFQHWKWWKTCKVEVIGKLCSEKQSVLKNLG